ncbi:ABC transporter ATP-binding protein [Thalassotalea profundi]|uniref:ABC transporter ATP-binding protein YvrO n=1 Tax=Thalassotalea profundi TaxID=2036687 RepID=A0ABQ3IAC3_9GAMM|nr:ABC transporter ATP-binding protein [Thalassotalea profundi]GHE76773.1 putative ABC transporter ATP-binding protein YvrO [Thalassotalea profundi]
MNAKLITVNNLSFRYPKAENDTLKGVSFEVNKGDYIAIVGTSGSGKSTLLSILGLLNKPTTGSYQILGTNTTKLTNNSLSLLKNNEIGFIFQNFNLLSQLTVYDNVALPLTYNPLIKRGDYKEKVYKALAYVNMEDYGKRLPEQLSGGQQQRIAIARALVNEPSLILADEPTGNLDSSNSQQVFELLGRLNNDGNTICLITHDMEYAKKAQQQWIMSDGQLVT